MVGGAGKVKELAWAVKRPFIGDGLVCLSRGPS
jgi:hypothetical protein